MAPSTRAAAASERLLKTPMATNESKVSTTRLFILATTGMSRSPPSNPFAEMFFKTRSRRVDLFGFSSFSVNRITLSCIADNPHLRLRIVYLPYNFKLRSTFYFRNWSFGPVLAILRSISSSGLLSVDSFEMDDLESRIKLNLEYVQSRR
jgi:hypothetical protein